MKKYLLMRDKKKGQDILYINIFFFLALLLGLVEYTYIIITHII